MYYIINLYYNQRNIIPDFLMASIFIDPSSIVRPYQQRLLNNNRTDATSCQSLIFSNKIKNIINKNNKHIFRKP